MYGAGPAHRANYVFALPEPTYLARSVELDPPDLGEWEFRVMPHRQPLKSGQLAPELSFFDRSAPRVGRRREYPFLASSRAGAFIGRPAETCSRRTRTCSPARSGSSIWASGRSPRLPDEGRPPTFAHQLVAAFGAGALERVLSCTSSAGLDRPESIRPTSIEWHR